MMVRRMMVMQLMFAPWVAWVGPGSAACAAPQWADPNYLPSCDKQATHNQNIWPQMQLGC
jgi:hypothetical protein